MKLIWLFTFLIASIQLNAAELYEVNTSVRALGMGNAYTSIVDDKDSLFYNPAGLARVAGINWTIFDLYLGANGRDVYEAYNDFKDAGDTATGFSNQVQSMFGKKIWVGGGGKAAITVPYLGFAVYDALTASAYVTNPAFPNINVNFVNDYGFAAGLAFEFIPEVFSVGMVGKRITRIGSSFPIGVSTLATLNSSELSSSLNNRGTGYAIDFGMNITIPTPVKPTFSFVWKNMGYTTFTKDYGAVAPPKIRDEMIGGFGLLIDLPGLDIRPNVDFKYMNRTDEQLGKKIHFGIELDFPLIDLRAGMHQGYYTLGVGVNLGLVKLDAATYGVELGEYPGQHEDRRYVLELAMELGFDPSLNFLKSGDKKSNSKLKQRR